mmetsp:Transcript_109009/g.184878  ORF Transcript_109009/g.184878 Transcript_109009/m.184878 type:complete len:261 (+) Transcript_109009:130-912(+)
MELRPMCRWQQASPTKGANRAAEGEGGQWRGSCIRVGYKSVQRGAMDPKVNHSPRCRSTDDGRSTVLGRDKRSTICIAGPAVNFSLNIVIFEAKAKDSLCVRFNIWQRVALSRVTGLMCQRAGVGLRRWFSAHGGGAFGLVRRLAAGQQVVAPVGAVASSGAEARIQEAVGRGTVSTHRKCRVRKCPTIVSVGDIVQRGSEMHGNRATTGSPDPNPCCVNRGVRGGGASKFFGGFGGIFNVPLHFEHCKGTQVGYHALHR